MWRSWLWKRICFLILFYHRNEDHSETYNYSRYRIRELWKKLETLSETELVDEEIEEYVSEKSNNVFDENDLKTQIYNECAGLISKYYDNLNISSQKITEIIHITFDWILNVIKRLENNYLDATTLKHILTLYTQSFHDFSSENYQLKYFIQCESLILPKNYTVRENLVLRGKFGNKTIDFIKENIQCVPISKVLQKFFELPYIFTDTMKYMQTVSNQKEIISNVIQTQFWKDEIKSYGNKIVLPIALYYDDYETNNVLGSHRGLGKCGAFYLNILSLPPQYSSKLKNIFLFSLFNCKIKKMFLIKYY